MPRPGMNNLAKRLTRERQIRVRVPIGIIFTSTLKRLDVELTGERNARCMEYNNLHHVAPQEMKSRASQV